MENEIKLRLNESAPNKGIVYNINGKIAANYAKKNYTRLKFNFWYNGIYYNLGYNNKLYRDPIDGKLYLVGFKYCWELIREN